jgi:hypothetical protein
MTKTAFLLTLVVTALATPVNAQQRVFVSGLGLDTNPCTVTQPCRTFQHAHDIAPVSAEIDVIDPAGYGPLTVTHGISIQAHGFGGVTQTANGAAAIFVAVTTGDPVSLNGLLLDGAGTGDAGINITSGPSVQILNSVVRHFHIGIQNNTSTAGSNLLIEDTIASDNSNAGIFLVPSGSVSIKATLNRVTTNSNEFGILSQGNHDTMIANSVLSNNGNTGLSTSSGITSLARTVISGNTIGVHVFAPGTVKTYGDNYINDNTTPVIGTLTPVGMQ